MNEGPEGLRNMLRVRGIKPLLLLISFLSVLCVDLSCRPAQDLSKSFIVGGKVPDGMSPALHSTVALVKSEGQSLSTVCSGILVAPRLVLTAAHCVELSKTKLSLLFGMADTDMPAKTVEIESSYTYKRDGSRFFPNFDIAWVKLREDAPAPWKPVELLRSSAALESIEGQADKILLAGFGRTASVCKNSECMGRLFEVWTRLEHFFNEAHFVNLLVIGPNPGHGTCNGDSGGPAFVRLKDRWLLAGILNGKSPLLNSPKLWEKGVCESGEAIYNFAGAYVDWIESSSGIKLEHDEASNPSPAAPEALDSIQGLGSNPLLEQLLGFNNHNENIWATVETLVSGFKDPLNRYGATVEELVTQPALAAAAMRRWTEFRHVGLSFDFVISSQKSNQLVDVQPIGELTSLRTLALDSNMIRNTSALGKLTLLDDLSLRNNYDYSKKKKVAWNFDFIRQLRNLKRLDLSNNSDNLKLHSIAWENLEQLEELELSDNGRGLNLASIPWEKLHNLKKLTIRNSQLTDIEALKGASSLEILDLSRNAIQSISALAELKNLNYLDLSMNKIRDFSPLSGLSKLSSLKALSNVQNEDFCPLGSTCVYSPASFSDFESYCRFAFTLSTDDLSHWSGGATVMRLIQIAGVGDLRIDGCRDAQIELSKLKTLDLSGSPAMPYIEDISPVSPLTQLETLVLSNNDLRDIRPLSNLVNLKRLDLSQNYIEMVEPLQSLKSLQFLIIDGNQIASLDPLAEIPGLNVFAYNNPIYDDDCPIPKGLCFVDDSGFRISPLKYLRSRQSASWLEPDQN